MKNKKLLALLLAVCLMAALFVGCQNRDEAEENPSAAESSESESSSREEADPDTVGSLAPDFAEKIAETQEINSDTVGWLQVPGTTISDAVLQKPDDETNNYYLRININKEFDFNGVYYADFRAKLGDTREDLGVNTCIYGHAIVDDKEDDRYDTKFGNLHNYRDEQYARENPYIYFSTPKDDMVFEIVAVFVANCDNPDLVYNGNPENGADYIKTFNEEIKPRSYYDYDVELDENDKFITLSTCVYLLENGYEVPYPETWMRYAIVAKLVDPDEPLKEEASLTVNEDQIFDDDGRWPGNV